MVKSLMWCAFSLLIGSGTSSEGTPFYWGAATSAFQVEGCYDAACGGKGPSIWDEFTKIPGKIQQNANAKVADDSYHKYKEDIDMLKYLHVNAYRFSISWSRIFPEGRGRVNTIGVQYYNDVINELLANNITPFVTLYHWDLPNALEKEYSGWLAQSVEVIDAFSEYAKFCFKAFGDRVKNWITFNEPHTFVTLGYMYGSHAPNRCSNRTLCPFGNSSTEPYVVAHNVLLAHAKVVDLYRKSFQQIQKGSIGMTLNQDWGEPFDLNDEADVRAADRRNVFQIAWFADPLYFGDYPLRMREIIGNRLPKFTTTQRKLVMGSNDFFGLNHYSTNYVQSCEADSAECSQDDLTRSYTYNASGYKLGIQAASWWLHVVPWGFYKVLKWNSERYNNPDIVVTENGVDAPGEADMTFSEAYNDIFRINFFDGYLSELSRARTDGVTVRGYFAWSLIDNFEWADGYSVRFGLCYINYSDPLNLQRLPKRSAAWYRHYIINYMENKNGTTVKTAVSSADSQIYEKERAIGFWDYLSNKFATNDPFRPRLAGGL